MQLLAAASEGLVTVILPAPPCVRWSEPTDINHALAGATSAAKIAGMFCGNYADDSRLTPEQRMCLLGARDAFRRAIDLLGVVGVVPPAAYHD